MSSESKEKTQETIPRHAIDQALAGNTASIMYAVYDAARRHTSLPAIDESADSSDKLTVRVTHSIENGWIRVQVTREGATVSHRAEIAFGTHGDGQVRRIWEIKPADLDAALEADGTKLLITDDMEIYDDAVLLMDGNKLVIRNLDQERTPEWGEPRYIKMPEYTWGDQEAMVFLRESGTVQCGLADLATGHLWLARSYTFDDPAIAMRRIQTPSGFDVEVYCMGDETEARLIYKNGACPSPAEVQLLRVKGAVAHSGWVRMRVAEDFARIRDLADYALAHRDFTCLETQLNRLNAEFHAAYAARDFTDAIAKGIAYLTTPYCHQGPRTPCGTYMGDTVMRYLLACALARSGQTDDAMHRLLEIESKWHHWAVIRDEADFSQMRSREDYQELMARHPVS